MYRVKADKAAFDLCGSSITVASSSDALFSPFMCFSVHSAHALQLLDARRTKVCPYVCTTCLSAQHRVTFNVACLFQHLAIPPLNPLPPPSPPENIKYVPQILQISLHPFFPKSSHDSVSRGKSEHADFICVLLSV